MKYTTHWRTALMVIFTIIILSLQIYALVNIETPPISFGYETIPGVFDICRGDALHYQNTFIIHRKAPIMYIRSVAEGHIGSDATTVKHITVQQDNAPLYFNVWEPQERINTLVFTPTATLPPGDYTLIVSASGINSDYKSVAMYKLEFTTHNCRK